MHGYATVPELLTCSCWIRIDLLCTLLNLGSWFFLNIVIPPLTQDQSFEAGCVSL